MGALPRLVDFFGGAAVVALSLQPAQAHPGRTDGNGCHHDRKTGEYHCHSPNTLERQGVGTASVIDGDSIDIHGQRYRISGIDAPESRQLCQDASGKPYRCGQIAANALAALIGRRAVSCVKVDVDRYQRIVARCSVAGTDIGDYMVSHGLAVAYRRYSAAYVAEEESARTSAMGIWAGTFDMPWDWRKAH